MTALPKNVVSLRDTGAMPEQVNVTVSYGPTSQEFELPQGATVDSVRGNSYIKEVIGFKGGDKEIITVNGRAATPGQTLRPGDNVEVIREAGEKA